MSRKIKLLWDFKGPDGLATAKHHCIHLKEFAKIDGLSYDQVNYKELNPMHSIAFIVVAENDMKIFRDALKPHRGEIA
ncbi:hypothetical protein J2Q11_02330 [Tenacibaculum finnmarkense genomovar finnmarkense]|uniref:Uncharacterized protein n=1 Tax=Tenacibaculum dicentrarchi TaxID=669041 RepID=A0ABP1ESZ9_9FLAO|nr:hypothetical protein [Tenacibaculum finnmarkense]MCD8404506.1 hypothetical protein [Tenacibaculum dicentrarchi]MCD8406707.1 hypothetical protein [Tenacibaculum dicentrarchi]MCD8414311.1 hypothetical protein [Tenacibaculum dicentrarchi]MCD8419051.1 hypothetical protein [Tenacibaculum dicentrarchi]MCD8424057.1 hypothetical protein [Tenacibaculum dicentrarchi]